MHQVSGWCAQPHVEWSILQTRKLMHIYTEDSCPKAGKPLRLYNRVMRLRLNISFPPSPFSPTLTFFLFPLVFLQYLQCCACRRSIDRWRQSVRFCPGMCQFFQPKMVFHLLLGSMGKQWESSSPRGGCLTRIAGSMGDRVLISICFGCICNNWRLEAVGPTAADVHLGMVGFGQAELAPGGLRVQDHASRLRLLLPDTMGVFPIAVCGLRT